MKLKLFYILTVASLIYSCDGGLEPKASDVRAFIRGTVHVIGKRPSADSLKDFRAVALKVFPTDSLFAMIISGRADFSPASLPLDKDEFQYELEVKLPSVENKWQPVEIKYFGLAINYGGLLDWKPVAVYGASGAGDTNHTAFLVKPGEVKIIDLTVDFGNLPANPFTQ